MGTCVSKKESADYRSDNSTFAKNPEKTVEDLELLIADKDREIKKLQEKMDEAILEMKKEKEGLKDDNLIKEQKIRELKEEVEKINSRYDNFKLMS